MCRKLLVVFVCFSFLSGCLGGDSNSEQVDYNLTSFEQTQRLVSAGFGATDGEADLLFGLSHDVKFMEKGLPDLTLEVESNFNLLRCSLTDSYENTECGLSMEWFQYAPSYSGAERLKDTSGMQDITATVATIQQKEAYCQSVTGIKDRPICGNEIYFTEAWGAPVNFVGGETLQLKITDGNGVVHWTDSFTLPTLDHDNDGFDDFSDECWNEYAPDTSNGCPDNDSDGILDEDDFYDLGNGGLHIWVSEVSVVDGETYDVGQRFPCSGGGYNVHESSSNSVPYNWVNDGEEDCSNGVDEGYEKDPVDPDYAWQIDVDWNCDGINDETYSMVDEGVHFIDAKTVTRTIGTASTDGMLLSKDVPDSLENVCFGVFVYDRDKAEGTNVLLDSASNTEWMSVTHTIPSSFFSSEEDYVHTSAGTNEGGDDDVDVMYKVTIRPYDVNDQ